MSKNKKSTLWLGLLSLAFSFAFLALLPVKAGAAVVVGEAELDAENPTATFGSGTAAYDAASKTLTLTNLKLKGVVNDPSGYSNKVGIYTDEASLNIVLKGENEIDGSNGVIDGSYQPAIYGIIAKKGALKISGPGSLKIVNVTDGIRVGDWTPESAGSLSIESGASIEIEQADIGFSGSGRGITVFGSFGISDSSLKIKTYGSMGNGLCIYTDKVLQCKNSTIEIESEASCISAGDSELSGGGILFDNCKVKLSYVPDPKATAPGEEKQYGIFMWPSYTVEGGQEKEGENRCTLTLQNGGTFETTAKTAITNQTDKTKISIPADSKYESGNGYGNDVTKDNKVKITVGTGSGSGGNGGGGNGGNSGNGGGNGDGPGTPGGAGGMGEDGTALGRGASLTVAEDYILKYTDEKEPAGTVYNVLQAKALKVTASNIKISWKKAPEAAKYIVYGTKCGKTNKPVKVSESTGTSLKFSKTADGKKISKGTYYKFIVMAVDGNGNVVSVSKIIHAATDGGKVGNAKTLTVNAKKNKLSLKAGKSFKLKVSQKSGKKSQKIKNHRKLSFESTDEKVAKVDAKGKVTAVAAGKCDIYVYAQNGLSKKIKVTVK